MKDLVSKTLCQRPCQCLVSKDNYEVIVYEKEDGVKVIQRLIPEKYKKSSIESSMFFFQSKLAIYCIGFLSHFPYR